MKIEFRDSDDENARPLKVLKLKRQCPNSFKISLFSYYSLENGEILVVGYEILSCKCLS